MIVSCITISGPHGAGTSSAGKQLAQKLGYRYISAGELFRDSAKTRGINIGEFTKIVEGDPFLKNKLDETLKEEARKGNVVLEGRLVGWIAKDIAELRVFLTADFETRVKRIAQRENKSVELAKAETLQREREEREWFLKNYGFDILERSVYTLEIDTTSCNIECVIKIILNAAQLSNK
ncbi:MAG: (d)CMP kinase [Candidatus Thorarchaeota archaeon]